MRIVRHTLLSDVKHAFQKSSDAYGMTTIGERVAEVLAEDPAKNQATLAKALGISRASVSDWITGKTKGLKPENIVAAADYLEVEIRWLATGELPKRIRSRNREEILEDKIFVKRVEGAHLSAGGGELIFDFEEVDQSHTFRSAWMKKRGAKAERCRLWSVRGDSMWPEYKAGDMVLINMADREIQSGEVYALIADDGLRIKRLQKRADGVIEMRSDNPQQHKYPPEPILDGNAAVIGRVIWRAGEV